MSAAAALRLISATANLINARRVSARPRRDGGAAGCLARISPGPARVPAGQSGTV